MLSPQLKRHGGSSVLAAVVKHGGSSTQHNAVGRFLSSEVFASTNGEQEGSPSKGSTSLGVCSFGRLFYCFSFSQSGPAARRQRHVASALNRVRDDGVTTDSHLGDVIILNIALNLNIWWTVVVGVVILKRDSTSFSAHAIQLAIFNYLESLLNGCSCPISDFRIAQNFT